jgi:biotin synthase
MCYIIPGNVVSIEKDTVTISYYGELKKAKNELRDLKIGDYVYAQGGYVIEKVPTPQAIEILETWKELFFTLQEKDSQLSQIKNFDIIDITLKNILEKVKRSIKLSNDDMKYLLDLEDPSSLQAFFQTANMLRHTYHANACCVHGIIEISNICKRNCSYCGINCNMNIPRYKMSVDEIVSSCDDAIVKAGFKAIVLQSGEDSGYKIEELTSAIKRIKEKTPSLICISFGEIGIDNLKKLYDAGARGLLLRFETSNEKLYEKLHPGYKLATRLEHIRKAYEMGYFIITGSLIGLEGQTKQDIINDILLAKELHAEMMSFGPYIPISEHDCQKKVSKNLMLKVIALARFVDPSFAKILITTSFETIDESARIDGLMSGASSLMLNLTPIKYRQQYSIYPNRAHEKEDIFEQINKTKEILASLGRAPMDVG